MDFVFVRRFSWKCPRTAAVMENISQYMPARQLQQIAGVGAFAFNTLYKLVWLKENHPQLLAQAHAWLFISSLINHRLTGSSPPTSPWQAPARCSISGSAISARRSCRRPACRAACSRGWLEAGQPNRRPAAGGRCAAGPPVGIPVISAGHDTQFALFGAGAGQDEPVLSSGTWEILMVRSAQVDTSLLCDYSGSTCELDSQPGRYNPGMQWLASGVLEWVRKLLWSADTPWQTLIDEAQAIPPGAQGVRMQCDLLASQHAGWQGVTLNTTRGHFYRAALEGLSDQLAQHLQTLEKSVASGRKSCCWWAAAAATRYGTRSRPTDSGYRSKSSTMPKPPWPARRCLAGMAWASSLRQNRPERRSRTATAISGRKLNLN